MASPDRDEGSKVTSEINVTPMVDVMLVLLIIFMVIIPMFQPPSVPVDMAKSNNPVAMPDAGKDDSIIVGVSRDGRIYLGNDSIAVDELTAKVKDKLDRRLDKHVFVKADAHAKYGVIVQVVDNIRSASVDEVGLLTEQQNRRMIPPPHSDAHKKLGLTT
ncbi:MAG TPA: biopolymer transporter ExbD [Terriglobales bacterium]|nr:biopolymer transporter ExbD [Terriglobales bacterium]